MNCADQMFGQRAAVDEGPSRVAQGAGIEIGFDIVVAGVVIGVWRAGVFLGLKPIKILELLKSCLPSAMRRPHPDARVAPENRSLLTSPTIFAS